MHVYIIINLFINRWYYSLYSLKWFGGVGFDKTIHNQLSESHKINNESKKQAESRPLENIKSKKKKNNNKQLVCV